jgi:hypothetical protein
VRGGRVRATITVFRHAWRRDRALTLIVCAFALLDALRPAASATLTGVLVLRATTGESLGPTLFAFLLLHGLPIGEVRWKTSDLLGTRVGDALDQRVMHAFLDPPGIAHLSDPEVQDAAARAITFWNSSILEGITSVVVTRLAGAGSAVVLVATGAWWEALAIALTWTVAGRWSWDRAREMLDVHFDKVPALRHAEYARDLAFRPEVSKDVRAFGLGNWVVDRYVRTWTGAMTEPCVRERQPYRATASARPHRPRRRTVGRPAR